MISHGDRVLVAISCSASSLSLLHALRQFSRVRNIAIELGACSIGAPGIDPRALMLYLRDLGIRYHYEERSKLHDIYRIFLTHLLSNPTLCSLREHKGQTSLDGTQVQIQCPGVGQYVGQISKRFHYVAYD